MHLEAMRDAIERGWQPSHLTRGSNEAPPLTEEPLQWDRQGRHTQRPFQMTVPSHLSRTSSRHADRSTDLTETYLWEPVAIVPGRTMPSETSTWVRAPTQGRRGYGPCWSRPLQKRATSAISQCGTIFPSRVSGGGASWPGAPGRWAYVRSSILARCWGIPCVGCGSSPAEA